MDVLAIDIGGTKHSLALFRGRKMIRRSTSLTDLAGGRAWMLDHLTAITPEWLPAAGNLQACGIGFGGPVDFRSQRVGRSMVARGWESFSLAAALESRLGVPCVMDNDANLGALGEHRFGASRSVASLLYVTLSTGIGAGIVLDGKIIRGADSLAGELGHIPLEAEGPECLCGARGCFEALCSGRAIEQRMGRSAAELLQDPHFRAGYIPLLARGLRVALMLLNPHRIVMGGGLSKAGEVLFAGLREELRRQIPASLALSVDVQPAGLGDDSVLWGALALAEDHINP